MNSLMNETISRFSMTEFYSSLINDNEVMMIYIGGSRLLGVYDEQSDYDLVVVVKDTSLRKIKWNPYGVPFKWVRGNDCVHCYIESFEDLLSDTIHWGASVGMMHLCRLLPEHILYLNPNNANLWEWLTTHQVNIGVVGSIGLSTLLSDLIEEAAYAHPIPTKLCGKPLYHVCCAYYHCNNLPLDVLFLNRVKRGDVHPLTDDDLPHVRKCLLGMMGFLLNNQWDTDTMRHNLLASYKNCVVEDNQSEI